mmetsp:Transcript_23295/g.54092  ORF Transcript_23295/g.54092 Transcript_23295/m.54092 type:complete len:292 (-) Transcript_23295:160-1035(-)
MDERSNKTLSRAKAILEDLGQRNVDNKTKKAMLNEYSEVLNLVVDAISKITDEEDSGGEDGSESSTMPETVASTDSQHSGPQQADHSAPLEDAPFDEANFGKRGQQPWFRQSNEEREQQLYGTPYTESQHQTTKSKRTDKRNKHGLRARFEEEPANMRQEDDEMSDSSDFPPYMDDFVLDEVTFTKELMGYEDGYNPLAYCSPISEEEEIREERRQRKKFGKSVRPKETTKKSHRRQISVESAPVVTDEGASQQGSVQESTTSAPAAYGRICVFCQDRPENERCKDGLYCI